MKSTKIIKNTEQDNCYCYKEGIYPVIEFKEYTYAKTSKVKLSHQEFLFVVKGSMYVAANNDHINYSLKEWEFIFVPIGTTLTCWIARDSAILIARMTTQYLGIRISHSLENKSCWFYPLQANDRIQYFIEGLLTLLKDGLNCRYYMQMEVSRILYLLHTYYPLEERIRFFSSMISPDTTFSEFIRLKWTKYMTVKGLANAMNLSRLQFLHQFKKVFGMNPHQWLQQHKMQRIYQDICKSNKTLKQIAIENQLTHKSFIRYCHKHFGLNPSAIREQLMVQWD